MAAGGGSFLVQNKILPGAYINFVSKARALGTLGERGIVALPWISSWGADKKVVEVTAEDFQKEAVNIFGYAYTDEKLLKIRELFKGANSILVYRIGGGEKASAAIGNLTVTALHAGLRGNDIKVVIQEQLDNKFIVKTIIGDIEADIQTVSNASELKTNSFIEFSGNELTETAGISLTGGTDKEITGNEYSEFLDAIESENFTALLYAGEDDVTKGLFESFTKRLRNDEGYKITTVLHNYSKADFEGVISVKNEIEDDKTSLVYWTAGQTAGAEVNESLTNKVYDGEYIITSKYKKSELTESIQKGEFVFYGDKGNYKVLKDINTFTSYEPDKNSDFSNNQVIRVLDAIANDTARIFDDYYLGKVQNNDIGRNVLKNELVNYHNTLQGIQAITNFVPDDIEVVKGVEKGDVIINEAVEPVGAMEKLYMTCIVE